MPRKKKNKKSKQIFAVITNSPSRFANHPFFVKKANEDIEYLRKVGFPKHLTNEQLGFDIEDFRRGDIP